MSAALRVGRISALNMYPLYHHLEFEGGGFAFTDGLPTALNDALLDGRLDVSAVSSIVFARNSDRLRLLPVASITADGAVDSIQVLSHEPFAHLSEVAVTPHSASSVALLRVLAGPRLRIVPLTRPPQDALAAGQAVLLIADEALLALRSAMAPVTTDLGALWTERTGLPMVFGVWAARAEAIHTHGTELAGLTDLLREARERFAADPEPAIAAAAERFPFSPEEIRSYLGRLRYGFGPSERAGLSRFCELARAAGELDHVPEIPRLAA